MPVVLNQEYENQNSRRRYPFGDTATLTDTDGRTLPPDFLLDAHLYPLDATGGIYLSSIDLATGVFQFKDAGTGQVVGTAAYVQGATQASIIEYEKYDRQIGVLVFGPGVAELASGRNLRTFGAEATSFCPTVLVDIKQAGVRGFLLPDGTLVTGNVTFEGRDGVTVTSTVDMTGLHILRFDIVGFDVEDDPCAPTDPPICTIVVTREAGSPFLISKLGDYALGLTAFDFTADDVCAGVAGNRLPTPEGVLPNKAVDCDPCPCDEETEPPPEPPADPGPSEETFSVCETGSSAFLILTPSTIGSRNPISVRTADPGTAAAWPNRLQLPKVAHDPADVEALVKAFNSPPFLDTGIVIGFKGVAA